MPLATADLRTAREHGDHLAGASVDHARGFAVVLRAGFPIPDHQLVCCRVVDPAGHRLPRFQQIDGDAPLRHPVDELTRTIDRVDDPNAVTPESRRVVGRLLAEPAFPRLWQQVAQYAVGREVRFG